MRKITSLLMLLCMFVGMAWAAPTDLPEMSTEGNIKYYTISNTRSTSGKYLYWTESGVKDANTLKLSSLFYFTGTAEECYIHNAATDLLFTGAGAWNSTGVKCEISVTPHGDGTTGLAIKFSGTALNEANTNNGYTTWGADDAGSVFVMEVANVTKMATDYKTAANSALDMISFLGVDEAKTTIANLEANINTFAAVDAAVNGVAEYVAFRNSHTDSRANHFLGVDMTKGKGNGHGTFNYLLDVWSLKYDGAGAFYLYNVNNEVYLGTPSSNGVLTVTPTAGYTFEGVEGNKVKLKLDGQTLHLNNHAGNGPIVSTGWFLSNYDDVEKGEPASQWYVESNFTSLVASYKAAAIAALDGGITNVCTWLGVDASLVSTAKTAINAIATTDYPTFAAIDAKFNNLAEAIAAKNVVFQNSNTEHANRSEVYLATNMNTNKGRGNKIFDYSAVWNLQFAGLDAFYLYNPLNEVYLGKPSDGGSLTDVPFSAYTFELIENNKVELKCVGQTLHVNNNAECTLTNYDQDESASRWYLTTIDITAEIQELITANATNHAEVPALGQYTTSAYNALVAAKTTAKTVEEVEAAIAAFHASLNAPVYIFSGVHDYANGKAIYYNGSNPEWRWDTKNAYNKAMWFRVLGLTTPEFELNTEYNVVDMSGRNIYNKASIKFETVENWDGVYCLKFGNGDADYLHLANHTNNTIANWYPATIKEDGTPDSGASAWKVEYIGTSYELANLTDEKIEALDALKTAYDAKAYYKNAVIGNGIGQYKGDKDAIVAELAKAEAVYVKTLVEQTAMTVEEINAITKSITDVAALTLNMPETGFYRIKSLNGNDVNKAGKYWQIGVGESGYTAMEAGTDLAKSIVYIKSNGETYNIVNYVSGLYLNNYDALDPAGFAANSWTIVENNAVVGAYALHAGTDTYYCLSDWAGITNGRKDANAVWTFEAVDVLPVAVTSAGYATLYAPVALTLADGLKAYYTAEVTESAVKLAAIEGGVIPANTAVILTGDANTYELTIATDVEPVEGNLFVGNVAATLVGDDAYVLAKPQDMDICFYKASKNFAESDNGTFAKVEAGGTHFLNNGFKAYLPASVVPSAARFLSFDFGTETAIESIEGAENGANAVIYDLAGRRVQKVQKGLYIVNGVKVIK